MTYEYFKLLKNLWDENRNNKPYSPKDFKEVLGKENQLFAGYIANDSIDLIRFLLERFNEELNVINSNFNNINDDDNLDKTNYNLILDNFYKTIINNNISPIYNLFYGIKQTFNRCVNCGLISYDFQIYNYLFSLKNTNLFFNKFGKKPLVTNNNINPDVDLYLCFEFDRSIFRFGCKLYCNFCKNYTDSLTFYLIIVLDYGKGVSFECKVNFPEQLNLYNYVIQKDKNTVYGLYGVICHRGSSSLVGHFMAYCRNRMDNKWHFYNDGAVSECQKDEDNRDVLPYILFYRALTLN